MPDVETALHMVRNSKVLAYDTETSGLDHRAFVCGYVFTDKGRSLYIPVRHEPGGNIMDAEGFETALNSAFGDRSRRKYRTVGHNLGFDLRMSRRHGVIVGGELEDTMINEGLIQDDARGMGLDDSCTRRNVVAKKGHDLYVEIATRFGGLPDRKSMANFWRLAGDNPYAVDYAEGDGVSTLALWQSQQILLDTAPIEGQSNLRQVWAMECALLPYLAKVNAIGLKISEDNAEQVLSGIDADLAKAKDNLPAGFNVRSPADLIAAYDKLGITDYPRTAVKGAPSFQEKWLETNELGQAVLHIRRLEKAKSSFIEPLINTHNQNGRVHPTINQSKADEYGAIGGRLSCSDPNLQAFPKRNFAVGSLVRKLVVPDYGDIYEADAQQQEPRLFAHYSQDEKLLAGYRADPPVDLHSMAMEIMQLERDPAKRLGMGILSMLGETSLAGHMGYSVAEAKRDKQRYLGGFPGIREFQKLATRVGQARGLVRTILGRVAHIEYSWAYKAVSRIIQGSGADHMKSRLLIACQFAEAEGNIDILMTIHDSLLFQCERDAKIKELIRLLEDVQTGPFNLLVPIPFEVARGNDWSEASYGPKIKDVKRGGWQI